MVLLCGVGMSNKLPAFQFYPGDWRKDPGVQSLSFHDRGVWFEILCLMHESEIRGKLTLNGNAMPQEALSRLLGLDNQILTKSLNTIIEYGVASLCPDTKSLMCRRMVRDEETREAQRNFGKQGGNPALCENYNSPGFVYLIQRAGDGMVKIGISENPTRRLYKIRSSLKGQKLEMLGSFHVDDMGAVENGLHTKYASVGSGEWFSLKNSQIEEIKAFLLELPHKGKSKDKETPSSSSSVSTSIKKEHTVGLDAFKEKFEEARKAYPGSKRGLDSEWEDFKKKHGKNVPEFVPLLMEGINEGIVYRQDLSKLGAKFIPQWKNLSTWLNQKCWEERFPDKVYV